MSRYLNILILLTLFGENGAQYMESPCPNIFQYQYDQRFGLYGVIQVADPDNKLLQLNIELSIGNAVSGNNGYIELASTSKQQVIDDVMNRRPVDYRVIFPAWQNIPPKITKILANGRLICSGPKLSISQVPIVTTINLQHTLRIDVQPLSFNGNLPQENSPNFNEGSQNNIYFDDRPPQDNGNVFDSRKDNQYRPFFHNRPNNYNNNNNNNVPYKNIFEMYGIKNPHNFNPEPPLKDGPRPILNFIPFQPPRTEDRPSNNPFFGGAKVPPSNGQNFEGNFQNRATAAPDIFQVGPNIGPVQPAARPKNPVANEADYSNKFDDSCGHSLHTNTLIVYGDSVAKGAYPWLAALFRVTNLGLNYTCSGSLISDRHIITAAHCVFSGEKKLKPNHLIVTLGRLNLQKWTQTREGLTIEAESIHPHPEYMSLSSDADIAMIVLSELVSFTNHIRPLCLWRGNTDLESVIGIEGTVVGWGRDEEGSLMTAEAKQTKLPIVSQEQCLRSSQQYLYITSNRTFCAGFRNGSGPCNGDSGSGFIVQSEGRWMLRGVVSMSLSTLSRSCDLKNYIVFTDASKFLPWISNFIK